MVRFMHSLAAGNQITPVTACCKKEQENNISLLKDNFSDVPNIDFPII